MLLQDPYLARSRHSLLCSWIWWLLSSNLFFFCLLIFKSITLLFGRESVLRSDKKKNLFRPFSKRCSCNDSFVSAAGTLGTWGDRQKKLGNSICSTNSLSRSLSLCLYPSLHPSSSLCQTQSLPLPPPFLSLAVLSINLTTDCFMNPIHLLRKHPCQSNIFLRCVSKMACLAVASQPKTTKPN